MSYQISKFFKNRQNYFTKVCTIRFYKGRNTLPKILTKFFYRKIMRPGTLGSRLRPPFQPFLPKEKNENTLQ